MTSNRIYPEWNFGPAVMTDYVQQPAEPHCCPVCSGAGTVSRPPHVAGDQQTWCDCGTYQYPCRACGGTGVLWR